LYDLEKPIEELAQVDEVNANNAATIE